MLKTLEIVHIGDVHFPESKDERLADIRDSGFPSGVAERAKLTPLHCVARKYTSVVEKKPDVLLFSGDLTSFGDAQGYRDCLTYLNQLFNLKRLPQKRLHAVPGNHDVDRLNVDPSGKDLRRKFETSVLAWKDLGIPILAVDAVRKTSVSIPNPGAGGVTLFSLNSSLGCGEMRYPSEIQNKLSGFLSDYAKSVGIKDAFSLIGETLDTPAFDQDHIEEVCHTIAGMNKENVPIVIAHHNILPQAIPRVAAYTELINGGVVRSRLSHLRRPVLYCHGHIHDNPVEIISEPEFPGSKVICIAAPEFSRGFNIISIEFATTGAPLGCIVRSFRLSNRDGGVDVTPIRIPFYSATYANVRHQGCSILPKILACLSEQETRFPDLLESLSKESGQSQLLSDALLEGEWLGTLELTDKQEVFEHWIVRKVIR